jgi:hypothetical protein
VTRIALVQIQHALHGTRDDHVKVGAIIGDEKPEGLLVRAAGEIDGRWKAVSIWESKETFERFAEERIRRPSKKRWRRDAHRPATDRVVRGQAYDRPRHGARSHQGRTATQNPAKRGYSRCTQNRTTTRNPA